MIDLLSGANSEKFIFKIQKQTYEHGFIKPLFKNPFSKADGATNVDVLELFKEKYLRFLRDYNFRFVRIFYESHKVVFFLIFFQQSKNGFEKIFYLSEYMS